MINKTWSYAYPLFGSGINTTADSQLGSLTPYGFSAFTRNLYSDPSIRSEREVVRCRQVEAFSHTFHPSCNTASLWIPVPKRRPSVCSNIPRNKPQPFLVSFPTVMATRRQHCWMTALRSYLNDSERFSKLQQTRIYWLKKWVCKLGFLNTLCHWLAHRERKPTV